MDLKKYQKDVDKWTGQFEVQYWTPHEMLASLAEEMGELAREINFKYGPKIKKKDEKDNSIGSEIADIIFTLTCLCNSEKIDLSKYLKKTIDERCKRDNNRFKKKTL